MAWTDKVVAGAIVCVLATGCAMAQGSVISVTTRLVQVNVIAAGKDGPVEGLTKDDFTLYDNGSKQKIAFFEVHSRRAAALANRTPAPLAPNEFTNRPDGSVEQDNAVLIVWDMLNTGFADQARGRKAVLDSLKVIRPGDRIGIYILNSRISLLQDFTSDSKQIADTLEKFAKWPDISGSDGSGQPMNTASGLPETFAVATMREERTRQASWEIMSHLARISGRKSLVWVSATQPRGLPYASDVDVYPVDPRGLAGFPAIRAENGNLQKESFFITDPKDGRARPPVRYTNNNDIRGTIDKAIADGEVTYTLGFYLDTSRTDLTSPHVLKIQTTRKEATLRYKSNYVPLAYAPPPATRINNAILSAVDSKQIAITARLEKAGATWHVQLAVGAGDLILQPDNGRRTANLDVVLAQRSAQGVEMERTGSQLKLDMDDAHYAEFLKTGGLGTFKVALKPGLAEIKIVVMDMANGNMGSLAIPIGL